MKDELNNKTRKVSERYCLALRSAVNEFVKNKFEVEMKDPIKLQLKQSRKLIEDMKRGSLHLNFSQILEKNGQKKEGKRNEN